MSHLLYSSNEMYSSTELIRKSKNIFNKILSNEIDKAIILRDGKPSFILLDFDKYEKIMAEYDELKTNKKSTKHTKKSSNKKTKRLKTIPPSPSYKKDENTQEIPDLKEEKLDDELKVLDDLDFDDEFKKEVERKILEKKRLEEIPKEIPNKEKSKIPELKEFWA